MVLGMICRIYSGCVFFFEKALGFASVSAKYSREQSIQ